MSALEPAESDDSWPPDAGYLARMVAAAERVANALPSDAPPAWRHTTYRSVLTAVLRDAVENETSSLEAEDTANLSRFVEDAARAARGSAADLRDDTFEIVLGALLEDWVDNWDGPGDGDEDDDD